MREMKRVYEARAENIAKGHGQVCVFVLSVVRRANAFLASTSPSCNAAEHGGELMTSVACFNSARPSLGLSLSPPQDDAISAVLEQVQLPLALEDLVAYPAAALRARIIGRGKPNRHPVSHEHALPSVTNAFVIFVNHVDMFQKIAFDALAHTCTYCNDTWNTCFLFLFLTYGRAPYVPVRHVKSVPLVFPVFNVIAPWNTPMTVVCTMVRVIIISAPPPLLTPIPLHPRPANRFRYSSHQANDAVFGDSSVSPFAPPLIGAACCHLQYRDIVQDEFLPEVTSSEKVIVHFFHKDFAR